MNRFIMEPEINVPSTEVTTRHRRIDGVDCQDKRSLSCEVGTKSVRNENDKIERKTYLAKITLSTRNTLIAGPREGLGGNGKSERRRKFVNQKL